MKQTYGSTVFPKYASVLFDNIICVCVFFFFVRTNNAVDICVVEECVAFEMIQWDEVTSRDTTYVCCACEMPHIDVKQLKIYAVVNEKGNKCVCVSGEKKK